MTERELDPELEWVVAELRRPAELRAGARERLLEMIREEPAPRRERFAWAMRPRTVSLPPLVSTALAAGLVGIGVLVGWQLSGDDAPQQVASSAQAGERAPAPVTAPASGASVAGGRDLNPVSSEGLVKFVLVAPQAAQVSVVGDFNGWSPTATPMSRQGGTWTVAVPLEPGRHIYAFVVNGEQWMPDPAAPLSPEDGFGVSNSVVLVGGPST
jgi:hypothetical protein